MLRTQAPPDQPDYPDPPPIEIRPAGQGDAAEIRKFINGLSVRTQFLRFFASVAPPSSGLLRGLYGADGHADVIIATRCGSVIGHAMAADRAGADGLRASDVGLVVTDRWQRRGVGSALLREVVDRAAARGVQTLVMDVLRSNDQMLAMIDRRWPDAVRQPDGGSVTIRTGLLPEGAHDGASVSSLLAPRAARQRVTSPDKRSWSPH
jgi:GNAT superfamily N-acetyltransferase